MCYDTCFSYLSFLYIFESRITQEKGKRKVGGKDRLIKKKVRNYIFNNFFFSSIVYLMNSHISN